MRGKKLSGLDFIERSVEIHNSKYDYSLVELNNSNEKVTIICPVHGEFFQTPRIHLLGSGCPLCAKITQRYDKAKRKHTYKKRTTESFIEEAKNIHGEKYDYSQSVFTNFRTKVVVVCLVHGAFSTNPSDHLRGAGCPLCKRHRIASTQTKTTSQFIEEAKHIHGGLYDYSVSEYIGVYHPIKVICPIHGVFEITPINHLSRKFGCPTCNGSSLGERKIIDWLNRKKIPFIREKTFPGCVDRGRLRFDFFLPNHNLCIEYDGEGHYHPINRNGSPNTIIQNDFIASKRRDGIKNKFCEDNGISLLRIPFWQYKDIPDILTKIIT